MQQLQNGEWINNIFYKEKVENDVDEDFTNLLLKFADCMTEEDPDMQKILAIEFLDVYDKFTKTYPDEYLGDEDICEALEENGIPYERAVEDLKFIRGLVEVVKE